MDANPKRENATGASRGAKGTEQSGPAPFTAPRPDALKRTIDPADFYRREIATAPESLKAHPDGWTQNFCCPFPGHEDTTGSFGVNLKTGAFRCFGCEAQGGSVIDFVMLRDGLNLTEARTDLADRYRVSASSAGTQGTGGTALKAQAVSGSLARNPHGNPREPDGPIPDSALASRPQTFRKLGAPSGTWIYRDANGRPLAYVLRFERPDGGKEFRPQTWTQVGGWTWKAHPSLAPSIALTFWQVTPRPRCSYARARRPPKPPQSCCRTW